VTSTQLKSSLHHLIDNSKNSKLLSVVYDLLSADNRNKSTNDWWDTLSDDQKHEIEKALHELESGKGVSHSKVMSKYKGKYC
jgi:hypothetical protein